MTHNEPIPNDPVIGGATADDPCNLGRSIQSWAEALHDADEGASQRAGDAILQVGMDLAAALPALAAALQRRSGTVRAQAAAELGRLGVRLLGAIPRFRAALRNIILTDSDEAVRTSALQALTLLGPMSSTQVPALIEALRDDLPATRAAAAQELAQLGADAKSSVSSLITSCLSDAELAVRVQAAAALWRIGRRLLPALPTLIDGLRDGDDLTCWSAADCLGDMGTEAAEAIPALIKAHARQKRSLIRTSIVLALERIDPKAASAIEAS